MTELEFGDRRYNKHQESFTPDLIGKLALLADNEAEKDFGETSLKDPSIIQITPYAGFEGPQLYMRAWHETEADPPAARGCFQVHELTARLTLIDEDAYLIASGSENNIQPLTTREALLIREINLEAHMRSQGVRFR